MAGKINVLVIGGGGREAALVEKIASSSYTQNLFCAPGNGGIGSTAKCVQLDSKDAPSVVGFCKKEGIGLAIIGPEAPLVDGLADKLRAADIPVFGPSRLAAELEGSKVFMKRLLGSYDIPTAPFVIFSDSASAINFIRETRCEDVVVKTSGLAAGKGAIVCHSMAEAENAVDQIMIKKEFGNAGNSIVIEKFLPGEEASFMALVDGENILPLETSQDHKRAFNGDEGPNTGGMGAYSPAPIVTAALSEKIMATIMQPTVAAMRKEGRPFQGVLYAGLMINGNDVHVLEFNVRFGDPEIQPILFRMRSDIVQLLLATATGGLRGMKIEWDLRPALCVCMTSGGYPGKYEKGKEILGLDKAALLPDTQILHAGTIIPDRSKGIFHTSGGRVLNVTALGDDFLDAQRNAYRAVDLIHWENEFHRTDIGHRAISRQ